MGVAGTDGAFLLVHRAGYWMLFFLALESTLIAHRLPYPQNLDTARELEAVARTHGVEPRTSAVLGGEIRNRN